MIDDLLAFYNGEIEPGQSWGVKSLDDHYPFKKNLGIHCGAAGSGKTDILLSMHASQAIRNNKMFVAYLDEGSMRMHYLRLIGQLYGKKLFDIYPYESNPEKRTKWHISRDQLLDGYNEVCKYAYLIDSTNEVIQADKTITTVLNAFKSIADKKDVQSALIDPKNAFSVDNKKAQFGAYEYDKIILSEIRKFQDELDIKMDLVVHPSKGARLIKHKEKTQKDEGDYVNGVYVGGQPKPVDIFDAENGAVIEARADDSLTFHRYRDVHEISHYTFLHVRKIKEEEMGGKVTDDTKPILVYKNQLTWRWVFDDVDMIGSVLGKKAMQTPGTVSHDLPF